MSRYLYIIKVPCIYRTMSTTLVWTRSPVDKPQGCNRFGRRIGKGPLAMLNCDGLTSSPSATPLPSQTHYSVTENADGSSFFGGDYSGLTSISMNDDSVASWTLPFLFPFFEKSFDRAFLSSNGLISFYNTADSAKASRTQWISKKSKPLLKEDTIYIVVLSRELSGEDTLRVADQLHARHSDPSMRSFRANVKRLFKRMRMLTIENPSEEALTFLKKHRDVLTVEKNAVVSIFDHLRRETANVSAPDVFSI